MSSSAAVRTLRNEAVLAQSEPIPIRKLEELIRAGKPALCKVIVQGALGSGFLITTERDGLDYYAFVTCNHVISNVSPADLNGIRLSFENVGNKIQEVILDISIVGYCWTDSKHDATIIELPTRTAAKWMHYGARFLETARPSVGSTVAIVQHPEGQEASIHQGLVEDIREGWQILHKGSTKPGSSGSPVLNLDCYVVGIHKGAGDNVNIAVALERMLEDFFKDRARSYKNGKEDEPRPLGVMSNRSPSSSSTNFYSTSTPSKTASSTGSSLSVPTPKPNVAMPPSTSFPQQAPSASSQKVSATYNPGSGVVSGTGHSPSTAPHKVSTTNDPSALSPGKYDSLVSALSVLLGPESATGQPSAPPAQKFTGSTLFGVPTTRPRTDSSGSSGKGTNSIGFKSTYYTSSGVSTESTGAKPPGSIYGGGSSYGGSGSTNPPVPNWSPAQPPAPSSGYYGGYPSQPPPQAPPSSYSGYSSGAGYPSNNQSDQEIITALRAIAATPTMFPPSSGMSGLGTLSQLYSTLFKSVHESRLMSAPARVQFIKPKIAEVLPPHLRERLHVFVLNRGGPAEAHVKSGAQPQGLIFDAPDIGSPVFVLLW